MSLCGKHLARASHVLVLTNAQEAQHTIGITPDNIKLRIHHRFARLPAPWLSGQRSTHLEGLGALANVFT
jgi:hypothetical protein